ncbi:MAG: hypothetical protein ISS25_01050 [Nanoarchaeota archaeon]|nr:hypothetical protein [DPANN group archaeon]MBL7116401.1 hypothetical protein [Nanoarchaeota archaeon]
MVIRESQRDCIRGDDDPPTTTWSGGDAVDLSLSDLTYNDPRQINPYVNAGGELRSTHGANIALPSISVPCE